MCAVATSEVIHEAGGVGGRGGMVTTAGGQRGRKRGWAEG